MASTRRQVAEVLEASPWEWTSMVTRTPASAAMRGGLAVPGSSGRELVGVVDRHAVGAAPEPEQASAEDVGSLEGAAYAIQFGLGRRAGEGLGSAQAGGEPDDLEAGVGQDSGTRASRRAGVVKVEMRRAAHEGDAGVADVTGDWRHALEGIAAEHEGVKRRSHDRASRPHAGQA